MGDGMRTNLLFVIPTTPALLLGGVRCTRGEPQATPASDTTPPVITQIKVEEATSQGLTVLCETDEPTIGRLEYGLAPVYEKL